MNKTLVVAPLFFIFLFILEKLFPLRKPHYSLVKRVLTNFLVSATTYGAAFLFVKPATNLALGLSDRNLGLLHQFNFISYSATAYFVLSFLLLDMTFYFWHRLNHVLPFFWRFHVAHHYDPDMDVTTSFRFHFVEVFYSAAFRFIQVLFIGVSLPTFLLYEMVFQMCTYFHHSNLRLPIALERLLSYVIVTPRLHGIHHSQVKNETNANYSVVFSFWDRLFATFVSQIPQQKIEIGVTPYSNESDNSFGQILLNPFRKQKKYWDENHIQRVKEKARFARLAE